MAGSIAFLRSDANCNAAAWHTLDNLLSDGRGSLVHPEGQHDPAPVLLQRRGPQIEIRSLAAEGFDRLNFEDHFSLVSVRRPP